MNNRLEWLTNTPASRFNALGYPHFRVVAGQPLGTSTYTAEELDSMGMVGVYRMMEEGEKDTPTLRAFARFFVSALNVVTKKPVETSEVTE